MLNDSLSEKQTAALDATKRYFDEGAYDKAMPLLNSLLSQKIEIPDVFHMLGAIYYENGKFKSSISSFKKALSVDPDFTDSSIGLSVVLNDLGKYEQAAEVFQTAQERLKSSKVKVSKTNNLASQIALKHKELSELYAKDKNYSAALLNINEYEQRAGETESTLLQKVSFLRALGNFKMATQILKSWINEESETKNITVYINLVEIYYMDRQPLAALSICEEGLKLEPENSELLNLYKNLTTTTFDLRQTGA